MYFNVIVHFRFFLKIDYKQDIKEFLKQENKNITLIRVFLDQKYFPSVKGNFR